MKKTRTYQTVRVQQVRVEQMLPLLVAGCIVALDVAKEKFVVALATLAGEVVKLFRFDHPTETSEFLGVVAALRAGVDGSNVRAAMEPTGTYGDAVRHRLVAAGVGVWMVSPKRTHDSQALFDNVPSLHDPKSALLVAKLCGMGLATEWKAPVETQLRLRALVELRQHEQRRGEMCFGRMEGMLSRHWPELGQRMDVRRQKSALCLLVEYPSPARVNADPAAVKRLFHEASSARLSTEVADGVIAGARATLGMPAMPEEERVLYTLATQALEAGNRMADLEGATREIGKDADCALPSMVRSERGDAAARGSTGHLTGSLVVAIRPSPWPIPDATELAPCQFSRARDHQTPVFCIGRDHPFFPEEGTTRGRG